MSEAALLWGLGLLAIALVLLAVDVFLPSAGVLALTALVTGIAGVVCLFNYSESWGWIGTAVIAVGGPASFLFGLKVMPHTPLGRKLILGGDRDEDAPRPSVDPYQALIGTEGEVVSDLRPVGTVRLNNVRYDALSEGPMIRAGTRVRVVGVSDGTTLRVRAVQG